MKRLFAFLALATALQAQTNAERPRVLGVAHVAFRVSDVQRTLDFYENVLGYEEPFSLKDEEGRTTTAFVKVNDFQFLELFPAEADSQGQLDHFALYTDNLTSMRAYLAAKGVYIFKDIHRGRVGNDFLNVRDPDGHFVEILQYSPNSLTEAALGKFLPATRVSNHITHVAMVVKSEEMALKFYREALGFREIARGGGDGQPAWIDLQAPDGSDYIELVLVAGTPSLLELKTENHFCLASVDVRKTVDGLKSHSANGFSARSINVQTGGSLPPRANLFDPDGVRIEIMEPMRAGAVTNAGTPHGQ